MRAASIGLGLGVSLLAALTAVPASPERRAAELAAQLSAMHPAYEEFIRAVRPARPGLAPGNLYMGLVRPGGRDPRRPADAPRAGTGNRYDLIVFAAESPWPAEPAWTRLLLDHEFFHARHLARGDAAPHPAFGVPAADRHLQEALAWGYNLRRADEGIYGDLPPSRLREARGRYERHRDALRSFVLRRQPAAWQYYARLLPERGRA